jgi:hypothetical protein
MRGIKIAFSGKACINVHKSTIVLQVCLPNTSLPVPNFFKTPSSPWASKLYYKTEITNTYWQGWINGIKGPERNK